ncbi:hypothetical protein C6A85_02435, partial [Mycobacterium sp. ITM-2017-0098]
MTTGDMYFIPRAYPHHIENIGTQTRDPESSPSPSAGRYPHRSSPPDPWHFLIFFDQPSPADIGYRASASA